VPAVRCPLKPSPPAAQGTTEIIFVPSSYRRTKADIGRIITALVAKLDEFPGTDDLADAEAWL
jgi:hypothetical protein